MAVLMKKSKIIFFLLGLLLFVVILSVCIGAVNINLLEFWSILGNKVNLIDNINHKSQQEAVLFTLRFPRVILSIMIGSGLGISGAAIQGLFRNPLAEPGLIGISSGASLFAVIIIVLEISFLKNFTVLFGYYAISIAAFTGACITTLLVYRLARQNGKTNVTTLLLAGLSINSISGAFTGLLTYAATDEQLRNITFWSLGSLGGASWTTVLNLLPFIIIPVCCLPLFAKSLNAIALGEAQAGHLGINVVFAKKIIIVFSTMAVGASVATAGTIGFIGLIVPHILRMICGADHKIILFGSALLGAVILTASDLISRTIVAPAELPIGIVTAIIGSPVFIYIIIKERKKNYQ